MIVNFNAGNQGQALLTLSGFDGTIVVWGFGPFWLAKDRTVESIQPTPPGGFNYEVRNGVYVQSGVLSLPWKGQLWLLNGAAANDVVNNAVFITEVPNC